jgi:hypothetical protein
MKLLKEYFKYKLTLLLDQFPFIRIKYKRIIILFTFKSYFIKF